MSSGSGSVIFSSFVIRSSFWGMERFGAVCARVGVVGTDGFGFPVCGVFFAGIGATFVTGTVVFFAGGRDGLAGLASFATAILGGIIGVGFGFAGGRDGLAGLASPDATAVLGGMGTGLAGAFLLGGSDACLGKAGFAGPIFLELAGTGSFVVDLTRFGVGFVGTDLAAGAAGFFGEFWLLLIFFRCLSS